MPGMPPGQSQSTASATSDAVGNITIIFHQLNLSGTFTGLLSVPSSPVSTVWNIFLNGTQIGSRTGPSEYGPLQVTSSDILELVSSNAPRSTQIQAVLRGSLDLSGAAPVQVVPTAQAIAGTTSAPPYNLVTQNITGPGGFSFETVVPPEVRTLVLGFAQTGAAAITNVQVTGQNLGLIYYNQAPYLFINNAYLVVVPFPAAIEGSVGITVTFGAGLIGYQFTLDGDPAIYDESIFYNGVPVAKSVTVNTSPLVSGPCRLLTGQASTFSSSTSAALELNGVILLSAAGGGVGTGVFTDLTFPPDFIVPAGAALEAVFGGGGSGQISVTTAYP